MRLEWVALVAVVAFLAGAISGIGSAVVYLQWVRTLDEDEREWRRADWINRMDARRAQRRRFIEDKGKSSW